MYVFNLDLELRAASLEIERAQRLIGLDVVVRIDLKDVSSFDIFVSGAFVGYWIAGHCVVKLLLGIVSSWLQAVFQID